MCKDSPQYGLPWQHCRLMVSVRWKVYSETDIFYTKIKLFLFCFKYLYAWLGRGCCWSTRGQVSSLWIWARTKPPSTTPSTEATTRYNSASARPTSSCRLIRVNSAAWSKKGTVAQTQNHGILEWNECVIPFSAACRGTWMLSTSCQMQACSFGTMATHFCWRRKEPVHQLEWDHVIWIVFTVTSTTHKSPFSLTFCE